jgi:hypothetical protein
MKVRVRVRAEACMAKKQIIKDFALTPPPQGHRTKFL